FNFDLSSYLGQFDAGVQLAKLRLDHTSQATAYPTTVQSVSTDPATAANGAGSAVVSAGGVDTLYFIADGKLWRTTGAVSSTLTVKDAGSADVTAATWLTTVSGALFF